MVNRNLEQIAQKLRACTLLPEYELWESLCACAHDGVQILRQVVVGGLIADIFCPALGLVIDVGGDTVEWAQADSDDREVQLERLGLRRLVVHSTEIKESIEPLTHRILNLG